MFSCFPSSPFLPHSHYHFLSFHHLTTYLASNFYLPPTLTGTAWQSCRLLRNLRPQPLRPGAAFLRYMCFCVCGGEISVILNALFIMHELFLTALNLPPWPMWHALSSVSFYCHSFILLFVLLFVDLSILGPEPI